MKYDLVIWKKAKLRALHDLPALTHIEDVMSKSKCPCYKSDYRVIASLKRYYNPHLHKQYIQKPKTLEHHLDYLTIFHRSLPDELSNGDKSIVFFQQRYKSMRAWKVSITSDLF